MSYPPFKAKLLQETLKVLGFGLLAHGQEAPQVDTGYPGSVGDHLCKMLQGFVIPQTWLVVDSQSNIGRYWELNLEKNRK